MGQAAGQGQEALIRAQGRRGWNRGWGSGGGTGVCIRWVSSSLLSSSHTASAELQAPAATERRVGQVGAEGELKGPSHTKNCRQAQQYKRLLCFVWCLPRMPHLAGCGSRGGRPAWVHVDRATWQPESPHTHMWTLRLGVWSLSALVHTHTWTHSIIHPLP